MNKKVLREQLAALEHDQWCEWTDYMLKNLSPENIAKWQNQIKTKYQDLPEDQKWSDHRWADKVLEVLEKSLE